MNTISTQEATLSRPQSLDSIQQYTTHFTPEIFVPSPAPWLHSALAQLWELESGGAQIPGVGDLRVETATAIRVRKVLSKLSMKRDLPVPAVSAFSGGGLSLLWLVGPREVKYTFWPQGVMTVWREQEGQEPDVQELADTTAFDPVEPIEWLFK